MLVKATHTWIAVRVRCSPAPENASARKEWMQRKKGMSASQRTAGTTAAYLLPKTWGRTGAHNHNPAEASEP